MKWSGIILLARLCRFVGDFEDNDEVLVKTDYGGFRFGQPEVNSKCC